MFGLAQAILLPFRDLPLIVLLMPPIFRGIAFEFRFKAERSQPLWHRAFHDGTARHVTPSGMHQPGEAGA